MKTISLSKIIRRNKKGHPVGISPSILKVILENEFDVIIAEGSTNFFTNLLLVPLCKIKGIKIIFWTADCITDSIHWQRKIINPIVLNWFKNSDAMLSYNSSTDRFLNRIGINKNKIFRAQNAIDTRTIKNNFDKFSMKSELIKDEYNIDNKFNVLFIGTIEKRKKVENLLKACNKLAEDIKNIKPIIIGDGNYFEELKNIESNLKNIDTLFMGRIIENSPAWVLSSDVVVLPGQGGLAINDALACGKPIIATNEAVAGGESIKDYIINGENGFIVQKNSIKDLKEKIQFLYRNPRIRIDMGKNALNHSKKCSIESMVNGFEQAIKYSLSK